MTAKTKPLPDKPGWQRLGTAALETFRHFLGDDCPTMSASIAYYVLFSIFPLVLGLVVALGSFLDATVLEERLIMLLDPYLPGSTSFVQEMVHEVVSESGTMGVVAVLGLFWSATSLLSAVGTAMNRIWDVRESRAIWYKKGQEFAIIGAAGLLLILSLILTTVLRLAALLLPPAASVLLIVFLASPLFILWGALLSVALTFGMCTLAYRVLPNTFVRWREAAAGALVAALLLEAAKQGFTIYVDRFASFSLVYGSLAGVIIFLLWAYIAAAILLLGAEVAAQWKRMQAADAT